MGQNIKFLRKFRGLSQRELAERLGLKRNNIASYEAGIVEPRAVTFIVIARFFDIDPVVLLTQSIEQEGRSMVSTTPGHSPSGSSQVPPMVSRPTNPTLDDVRSVVEGLREFYRTKNAQLAPDTGLDQDIDSMLSALTSMLNGQAGEQNPGDLSR